MKALTLVLSAIVLFASWAQAESRSVHEKIFGSDFLSASQTVPLGEDGQTVTLTTPYKIEQKAASGLPSNQLITNEKRSIVFIDEDSLDSLDEGLSKSIIEAAGGKSKIKDHYIFANFVAEHPGSKKADFFVALLPKNFKVQEVYLEVEWFGSGVGAHAQLRFLLNDTFEAIPQMGGNYSPIEINHEGRADIIYSLQAVRVEGGEQQWDPLKGLMGEYANALQFFNTATKARMQIESSLVNEYKIEGLSDPQKKAILLAALSQSNASQESEIYNTVYNSCVTHALKAIKGQKQEDDSWSGIGEIDTTLFNPYSLVNKLNRLTSNPQFPGGRFAKSGTLNDEFESLVGADRVMTGAKLMENPTYQTVSNLRRQIIEQDSFDNVVKGLAHFIAEQQISYSEAQDLLAEMRKDNPQLSGRAELVAQKIKGLKQAYLNDQSLKEVIEALSQLKTQEIQ